MLCEVTEATLPDKGRNRSGKEVPYGLLVH